MARLPIHQGDDGTWGSILNDYLSVEHNADGTHSVAVNPDATTTSKGKIQLAGDLAGTAAAPTVPALSTKANDSAVVHNTGAETIAGVKTFSSSPIVPTPSSGTEATNKTYVDGVALAGAPDATTSSKGIVQLAGDLAGTAALPTVPGLAAKAADSAVVHNTGAETIAGVKTFSSAPVVPSNAFPESAVTNLTTDLAAKANDSAVVHNTGAETVAGVKTFSSSPIVPTPTTGTQAANKTYVDGVVGGAITVQDEGSTLTAAATSLNFTGSGVSATNVGAAVTVNVAGGGGGSPDSAYGYALLDDFAGADDDAKLTAALATVSAETFPRTIRLGARQYNFATGGHTPFRGMRIEGPPGYGNPEQASQTKMPCRVHLTMTGGWFDNSSGSSTFSVSFSQLSFTGGSNASVMTQSGAGAMYCMMMRDISSSGLRTVLGTQASKLLITAAQFDGYWEINNSYNGAFHMGGSDNTLWPDGMLIDSGTAFAAAGSANGQYHLWLDFMEKTTIGPLYLTAEAAWNGIRVSGPAYNNGATGNSGGPLWFTGLRAEGRNSAAECNGAIIRVEGGIVNLRDCWIAYGMGSPATPGHSPQDAGLVHQTAGFLGVYGCTTDHALSVAEASPFVYSAGGICRVHDISVASKGGVWSGLPRVDAAGGTVTGDDTVTVI